ncbi:unnamed protein product [Hymenolepis diminuta]|uniref:Uncharacterized protein n=1 Tax=Hymenolepis diminuta TaxID=6216 RepID=A0A564XUI1_HYMDI|nr:unnamed protein product [Hymenolepis diminuta]
MQDLRGNLQWNYYNSGRRRRSRLKVNQSSEYTSENEMSCLEGIRNQWRTSDEPEEELLQGWCGLEGGGVKAKCADQCVGCSGTLGRARSGAELITLPISNEALVRTEIWANDPKSDVYVTLRPYCQLDAFLQNVHFVDPGVSVESESNNHHCIIIIPAYDGHSQGSYDKDWLVSPQRPLRRVLSHHLEADDSSTWYEPSFCQRCLSGSFLVVFSLGPACLLNSIHRLRRLRCIIAAGHFRDTLLASSSALSIRLELSPRITLRAVVSKADIRLLSLILRTTVESP